jgi:hypothetical protein
MTAGARCSLAIHRSCAETGGAALARGGSKHDLGFSQRLRWLTDLSPADPRDATILARRNSPHRGDKRI